MNDPYVAQATKEDLKESKRKCWSPNCKKTAWFQDWCGWNWCWYHAYFNGRWGGGNKWFWFKTLKIRNPF